MGASVAETAQPREDLVERGMAELQARREEARRHGWYGCPVGCLLLDLAGYLALALGGAMCFAVLARPKRIEPSLEAFRLPPLGTGGTAG
jgi:hypothetical protein